MSLFALALAFLLAIGEVAIAASPEIHFVRPSISRETFLQRSRTGDLNAPHTVPRFEKFELQVHLQATFDNPYDPDELDLWAEFTAPSGKTWRVWGFYNPGYFADWMVRFTPTETGDWKYVVKVRDQQGTAESSAGEFKCVRSKHHGFVSIADNKRYLQFSDGSSFYGIGLWYNDSFYGSGRGSIRDEALDELRQQGVNFISFFPTLLETFGTGLGRYDSARVGRIDQIIQWCEEREIHVSWNLVFHSNISEAVWGGGNALYRDNPYRTVTSAKDYFASEEGWKYQQKLYRYIIARWGYSRAIFLWFTIDEINGTEGWTEGNREALYGWCRRMNDYFHENDPYGRPTTGTQSGGVGQWWPEGYRIFDIAGREIYEAQGHKMPAGGKPDLLNDNPLRASYRNYAKQAAALWSGFEKPAIIAECGWDHTYYEPGMPGYLAMYHNALWASLANGISATPFWWAYSGYINNSIVNSQTRNLAEFVRNIDFAGAEWKPTPVTMSTGDGWAMQSDQLTFGWVANPMSGVAKETFTVEGLADGNYDVYLYRTWRGRYLQPTTITSKGGKITVEIPELVAKAGRGQHMGDDVAFKIVPEGTPMKIRRHGR